MFALRSKALAKSTHTVARWASTAAEKDSYKVVVIGAGTGGLNVANQIYNRFKSAGKALNAGDIAIVDAAEYHYYQPGWTLVGSGLKQKEEMRRPMSDLIPSHLAHIVENVKTFEPKSNSVTTTSGRKIGYESLVVAAGIQVNWSAIPGLEKALADPSSGVSSIYSYNTADKTWKDIDALRSGKAIFTQPAGVIKCAGGTSHVPLTAFGTCINLPYVNPSSQKIMWMAWDRYQRTGRGDNISIDFYTGMPTMFSVKKYSDALNKMREERGVGAQFVRNLTSIDAAAHKATFKTADGSVDVDYTLLHVTPPMGPLETLKSSPLADEAGWVAVDQATLRHTNPEYGNVWALGDCSSLPTSKTAAAITAQAPILTENLFSVVDTGKVTKAAYDGYTSCPLLTGYNQLMLAEFKYGLEPKESFASFFGDQAVPRLPYYLLKKDLFPYVYWNYMVKGTWFGASGWTRPDFS